MGQNTKFSHALASVHAGLPVFLLAGAFITLYARTLGQFPVAGSDELIYLDILHRLENAQPWPVSGPGFVWILQWLHGWTNLSYPVLTTAFGAAASTLLPATIYLLYVRSGMSRTLALQAVVLLFVCSYFVYPLLVARPQQWGMVLCLLTVLRFLQKRRQQPDAEILLWLGLTFVYHVLSFAIAAFCIAALAYVQYFAGRLPLSRLLLWLGILLSGWLVFPLLPFYQMMFRSIRLDHFIGIEFTLIPALAVAGAGGMIAATALLKKIDLDRLSAWTRGHAGILVVMIAGAVVIAAIGQYLLAPPGQLALYEDSFLRFSVYQAGNLLFALLFLYGLYLSFKNADYDNPFFQGALVLMGLGVGMLILSVFLRDANWMIRVINYWSLFAAPIAAVALNALHRRFFYPLISLYVLGMSGSILHVTKTPLTFI